MTAVRRLARWLARVARAEDNYMRTRAESETLLANT